MNNILDQEIEEQSSQNIAIKFALAFALLTIGLIIYLTDLSTNRISTLASPPMWVIIAILVSCLLGAIFSIISVARKERWKYFMPITLILNFLIVSFLISAIVLAS